MFRYYLAKDFRWIRTSFELPFMAFFVAAAASLITSVDFRESLKEIRGELLTPILLFYISYFAVKRTVTEYYSHGFFFIGSLVFSIASFYTLYMNGGSLFEATYRAGGLRDPRRRRNSRFIPHDGNSISILGDVLFQKGIATHSSLRIICNKPCRLACYFHKSGISCINRPEQF